MDNPKQLISLITDSLSTTQSRLDQLQEAMERRWEEGMKGLKAALYKSTDPGPLHVVETDTNEVLILLPASAYGSEEPKVLWITSAQATDLVEKLIKLSYGPQRATKGEMLEYLEQLIEREKEGV